MRTLLALALALVAGLGAGAGAVLTVQSAAQPGAAAPTAAAPQHLPSTGRHPVVAPPTAPALAPRQDLLLVWTPGGLPPGLRAGVAALPRVSAVTVVRGGLLELVASHDVDGRPVERTAAGFVVPLDAVAFDPLTYPAFVPSADAATFAGLGRGQALLGETSARLRQVGAGGRLTLAGGRRLDVAAVVDDTLVGAAEVAVAAGTGPRGGPPRYLLLQHRGRRPALERRIRRLVPAGTPVRVRGPGETPYLRHGDAVLPQAAVKARFGEFSYRPGPGDGFLQEPGWAARHLATRRVPLLGQVRCHRALLPALRGALRELRDRGLGWTVDPAGYAGCHNARLTRAGDAVSRHAWGVALDVNAPDNPYGASSAQDPRLVEAFRRWGFTWGGEWLVPDPAHFEYVQPPRH